MTTGPHYDLHAANSDGHSIQLPLSAAEKILKPLYEQMCALAETGNIDEAMKIYHEQAVVVEKGKGASYGHDDIRKAFQHYYELVGPHKFVMMNSVYDGSGDFLSLVSDFEIISESKGVMKGEMTHIWKKTEDGFKIYHEESQM